jgi:hypothetical protein
LSLDLAEESRRLDAAARPERTTAGSAPTAIVDAGSLSWAHAIVFRCRRLLVTGGEGDR